MKTCKKCHNSYPLNKDYFGHTPKGSFRGTCRFCMRKTVKNHAEENPGSAEARAKKRKDLQAQVKSNYDSEKLRLSLKEKQKGKCFYCKCAVHDKGELDHMIPIIKGGLDKPENIVWACMKCNKEKHNKNVEEYRAWLKKNSYSVNF